MASTPSQTAGPFVSLGTDWLGVAGTAGEVTVNGRFIDGSGEPVTDALLEFWQADAGGGFPAESGLARAFTDSNGHFGLATVKPGPVEGWAPHLAVSIFARGLMQRLVTLIYFGDEDEANRADPLWAGLPTDQRDRITARPADRGGYTFDIHLQGERETLFFHPFGP